MMMICRKMLKDLEEWRGREHKSLLIDGPRGVGKTALVREFARSEGSELLEVDISRNAEARRLFQSRHEPDDIVSGLEDITGQEVDGNTLILLDEVQDCPRARQSLKWFTDDGRYDVIATGSMIGWEDSSRYRELFTENGRRPLIHHCSEEHLTLRGLDFEEFLWATGVDERITEGIRECISDISPIDDDLMKDMMDLFGDFMQTGGMPTSVGRYLVNRDPKDTISTRDRIISGFPEDAFGYAGRYGKDALRCLDIVCDTMRKEERVIHADIDDLGTVEGLGWLYYSGLGIFCGNVDRPTRIFNRIHWSRDSKVHIHDTGILARMYGEETERSLSEGRLNTDDGALLENIIAECMVKCGITPSCFSMDVGEGRMELDFVTVLGCRNTGIEVDSGRERDTMHIDGISRVFDMDRLIVFDDGNIDYEEDDDIEHYPYFCAAFMDSMVDRCEQDLWHPSI